jgi:glycosyltransferase involved in cell wall biosynthesis
MKINNILILTTSLNIGGGEKHIYNLVSGMDERQYKFVIVCMYELGQIGESLLKERKNISIYHNVMKNRMDIAGAVRLLRIMREEKINILFMVHTPVTLFWGVSCASLAGIKAMLTRSPTTNPSAHVKRWKIVNYLVLRYVSKIIAQAYAQRGYLIDQVHVDPDRIVVIHNGVDIERFSQPVDRSSLRETIGIPQGVPIVGTVGRLEPQKGHANFLRCVRKVLDKFPDTRFLIIGDGGERQKLEAMARDLSIQKNVLFLGMVNNVSQIVSLFDIGVLASMPVGETFSNAILEYMAASKPVVATNVGSIAEQVKDRETGYLVSCDDPNALKEAIVNLLTNKTSAKKMGEAGRAMVEEQFTIQQMIVKYETVFTDLLK